MGGGWFANARAWRGLPKAKGDAGHDLVQCGDVAGEVGRGLRIVGVLNRSAQQHAVVEVDQVDQLGLAGVQRIVAEGHIEDHGLLAINRCGCLGIHHLAVGGCPVPVERLGIGLVGAVEQADFETKLGALGDNDGGWAEELTVAKIAELVGGVPCLLYTSPSPRDATLSRMPSSA